MLPHLEFSLNVYSTLGTLVFAIYVVSVFKAKIDLLLTMHTKEIEAIHERLRQHDVLDERRFNEMQNGIMRVVGDVQRLIGQSEIRIRGDRRTT